MIYYKEFVLWLRGFVDAVDGIPTQAQWDLVKSKLSDVGEPITWPTVVPNTEPMPLPYYRNPWENPFKVTCEENPYTGKSEAKQVYDGQTGSSITDSIVTDGFIQDSSVTRAQPPFTLTTTSTTYGYPSGSNVSYTVKDK